jgi:uncharacterized membrane protein YesL
LAKFFSFDSKTARFLSRIWDLFLLNLLFLLGSLPVVTFGASAIAAYTVMLKIVEESEDSIIPAYFRAFKANLRQGLVLTIALYVLIAAVAADFVLFNIVEGNPIGFLILGIVCAVLVFVHFFYVFALAARYRNSLYGHLTNSRNIFIRFFGRSLLCSVLVAFEVWLFFLTDWLLLFIGVFIAPILIIATISAFAMKLFRMIEAENESGEGAGSESGPGEEDAGRE